MRKIQDISFKDKKVVMRIDFNVPLDSQGIIVDDNRIKAALPTIKYILGGGASRLILISHLGRPVIRPKEKLANIMAGNSQLILRPVAEKLAEWLKIKDCQLIAKDWSESPLPVYRLSDKLLMMENIRFLEGEQKSDPVLSKQLAKLGDVFVFDAFAVAHHGACSVSSISHYLPSYAGFLVQKEIESLSQLMQDPPRPLVMILGGAKIDDKILMMKNLIKKVDFFLLGGVMANTFLASRNVDLKASVVERDRLEVADKLMYKYSKKIILPVDLVWDRGRVVDIGKGAVDQYARYIKKAKMIFINGTMGLTSTGMDKFVQGTSEILKLIVANCGVQTIISGGDTVGQAAKIGMANKFTYVSTGGGASLEFLAGKKLPGIRVLE